MREDPFVTLGIDKGATQNEIYDAYKTLRNRYAEERFMEGEAGANAAINLQKLDLAYAEALEYNHQTASILEGGNVYGEIKKAISEKNLDKSQSLLDSISRRDAEWHYYQSIVFYERSWFAECKKQLEIALDLEPENEKYTKSLENLKSKLSKQDEQAKANQQRQYEQSNQAYGTGGTGGVNRSYTSSPKSASDGCCGVCQGLICADCCCECLGGDLIRCC
ncbi:MAG TPA: hypothetical protein VJZ69_03105 [Clostridia bacterium]|nr:hypothetical protein [Clostridia bacterium]